MLSKLLYCALQLNANNSSTYKIKKFKELYDAGYINKELWNLIYDKDVLFHITSDKIDKNLNVCRSNKDYKGDIIELLKDLYVQYSGNTALAIACSFVNNNIEYKHLIYDVIDKDLHIGMTAKSINKAVPGFFTEFNVALASPNNGTMPDENWVIERKEDGCFKYDTPVVLSDGTSMPIGKIVDERLQVEVLSYNEKTGKIEPKKVINWFNNGLKDNWVRVRNTGSITLAKLNRKRSIICTPNHKFFDGIKFKPIMDFSSEDRVFSLVDGVSDVQGQVILGSVMGDGCITVEKRCKTRTQARLSFSNGIKQKDYFDKKCSALKNIIGKTRSCISGYGTQMYGTHTRTLPYLNNLYDNYSVDYVLDRMSLLGLAIWYMDDGSRSKDCTESNVSNKYSRASFSTYAFTLEENKKIINWFNKKGYDARISEDSRGKGYKIDLRSLGSQVFFKDIAPYIPESMEYKLPIYLRGGKKIEWWNHINKSYGFIEDTIMVEPCKKLECTAYDIEVEDNHNYFAGGMLVHNCRLLTCIDSNGKVKFYSRKGKEFHTLDVLKKELEDFVALHPEYNNKVLDGEMCIIDDNGNEDFQGIMKEITRKDHTIKNPSYCVFDLLNLEDFNKGCSTETYKPRLNKLKTFVEAIKSSHIKLIEYAYYTPEIFATWQKKVLDNGWEGLIARKDVHYEGKRSRNLLKYKNFSDAEYVVKDVVLDGNATILVDGKTQRVKCVQSLVIEHKGYIVNVGSGLTQQQRIEFAEHPEHIIGKTITVQYFSETTDKDGNLSLRFPTIKYIYDRERNL